MLIDNHGRHINYLRFAVTDRCNLRCLYCMPAEGLDWLPRTDLLSFEESEKLLWIFSKMGITKLRFTGGEPFMRKDFMQLLESVSQKKWFETISITTNGTLLLPHIPKLKELGIHSVNLSLDTLDRERFKTMTRRDDFQTVIDSLNELQAHGIKTKLNAVIIEGKNEEDILPLVAYSKDHPVDVRFIEEMPFNGTGNYQSIRWTGMSIITYIQKHYPALQKLKDERTATVSDYIIPGHQGKVGVIAAYTRSFCGTCNRIRINSEGKIKTCLYGENVLSLREMVRSNSSELQIMDAIQQIIGNRFANGFDAEKHRHSEASTESMANIGG